MWEDLRGVISKSVTVSNRYFYALRKITEKLITTGLANVYFNNVAMYSGAYTHVSGDAFTGMSWLSDSEDGIEGGSAALKNGKRTGGVKSPLH